MSVVLQDCACVEGKLSQSRDDTHPKTVQHKTAGSSASQSTAASSSSSSTTTLPPLREAKPRYTTVATPVKGDVGGGSSAVGKTGTASDAFGEGVSFLDSSRVSDPATPLGEAVGRKAPSAVRTTERPLERTTDRVERSSSARSPRRWPGRRRRRKSCWKCWALGYCSETGALA